MNLLFAVIVGGLAGWMAGKLTKGKGYGILFNILLGVVGGLVGGYLFKWLDISTSNNFLGSLATALIGSILLLFIGKMAK
jgi:uncharacterized membrane protein YeaQ/YmgE (transglycosylase-associated protein family)